MNKTTNLPKTHRPFTDKYFLRTAEILRYDDVNPYVKMQVFVRKGPGEIRGLEEAVEILEKYSNLRKNGGHIFTLPEGSQYESGEVVMTIEGFLQDFVELETMYLGVISAATTLANDGVEPTYESVHKRAKELVEVANGKPCLYFGARHWHYSLDEMITKSALDAGFAGSSTDIGARTHDLEGSGTIPHALVLAYGSTVEAAKAFNKYVDEKVPRIVLIDTFNREISDTLATCYALGNKLAGIRIDTCGENICEKGTENNGTNYETGHGVTIENVRNVRQALDANGFQHVKIYVSSGFGKVDKVKAFVEAEKKYGRLVDGFGIGGLFDARFATADVVRKNGQLFSKTGRYEKPTEKLMEVF